MSAERKVRIAHFSCGASSAVAAIIGKADVLLYAETHSEHPDNERFAAEIEAHMGKKIIRISSDKYADTWDVWERERFLANRFGAPCTRALKLKGERIPLDELPVEIEPRAADQPSCDLLCEAAREGMST